MNPGGTRIMGRAVQTLPVVEHKRKGRRKEDRWDSEAYATAKNKGVHKIKTGTGPTNLALLQPFPHASQRRCQFLQTHNECSTVNREAHEKSHLTPPPLTLCRT
ncbi:hypothetical protein DPEC_G00043160 [Dallia pectoralis]|uniref:Uncharacterized protein n=1 Tax=Dallia pectoralis TaxID=75939 RepID=A0ACC2H9M8_DALPE|nr:hypothetical protein DPEC_G00043160 [Dallia pectoralis]